MAETEQKAEPESPKTAVERLLGETLVITGIGAVLYFWGILYYRQLAESLGLGLSLFSVSPYEVIIAPWDNAIRLLLYTALFWLLWHQRHVFLILLYYVVVVVLMPVAFCLKLIRGIRLIRSLLSAVGTFF
jgi:hypothetical protein